MLTTYLNIKCCILMIYMHIMQHSLPHAIVSMVTHHVTHLPCLHKLTWTTPPMRFPRLHRGRASPTGCQHPRRCTFERHAWSSPWVPPLWQSHPCLCQSCPQSDWGEGRRRYSVLWDPSTAGNFWRVGQVWVVWLKRCPHFKGSLYMDIPPYYRSLLSILPVQPSCFRHRWSVHTH